MLDRFLAWLKRRGSYRLITRRDEQYLDRYYLLRTDRVSIMIHRLLCSDDPAPHDHPWNNFTLVLRGGYREHYHDGSYKWIGTGAMRYRSARELHWLEKTTNTPPMTLFVRFRRQRAWGFIPEDTPFERVLEHPGRGLRGRIFPRF